MTRRRRATIASLAAIPALAIGSLAMAQTGGSFNLSWFGLSGGGGSSSGGQYVVTGAIGQPFASQLTGGSYTLQSGFYGGGSTRGYRLVLPLISSDKASQP